MNSTKPHEHGLLYEINTRVWLTELGAELGRTATLDDIPEAALDRIAAMGFKWVWLLGVWRLGRRGPQISRTRNDWREEFRRILPDLSDDDICGSCFAVVGHTASPRVGGAAALGRLRRRLRARNLRLILDFIPNHTAIDHPWVATHPDFYVGGSEDDLAQAPHNYFRAETAWGPRILAHGRDPYFPGWPDTAQLNYVNPAVQAAMQLELLNVAGICDGVRCDMAMLVLPEVFQRTWGTTPAPFWPTAIAEVRASYPDFKFIAEVYWDLEWTLQQQGFDFTYDKRLYDRLRGQNAVGVREHLAAGLGFQSALVRFLENHDEPRSAAAFPPSVHEAAAILTYLSPGLRFFHQGQLEGRKVHVPVHLCRAPAEAVDATVRGFYQRLLKVLRRPSVRSGAWSLVRAVAADPTDDSWQGVVCFLWSGEAGERLLVVVNYAAIPARCRLEQTIGSQAGGEVVFRDLMGPTELVRSVAAMRCAGLEISLPPWGYHVFELRPSP